MSTPANPSVPPMAEPGSRPAGASVGGMRSTADAGLADAAERRAERQDTDTAGPASTGDASGGTATPRIDAGGKNAPGSSGGALAEGGHAAAPRSASAEPDKPSDGNAFADEKDEWRHAPVAPRDEKNPLKSIGEAVGEVVTGIDNPPPAGEKQK